MLNPDRFITDRLRAIDASGIRRVFDLAAQLKDPINLSIGQPDFDVPDPIKRAAADAIDQGFNRYTQTQGIAELRAKLTAELSAEFPETLGPSLAAGDSSLLITSGVSGGLMLAMLTCVGPGDEVLIPDPYFVMYKHLVTLAGATPVYVDTYPDFQVTPERLAEKVTQRTKLVLFNTPSNPTGVVAPPEVCEAVTQFCAKRELLLLSDEIYDVFQYTGESRFPSPLRHCPDVLLMRGFSKTYGMTGWRLGYAVGPTPIVEQMTKLQQYSFVCAPSMTQMAGALALDIDMSEHVAAYARKRDRVVEVLSPHYELTVPGGAFYAFPKVPERLGMTATQFVEAAVAKNLLIIPGNVFSQTDTHFRLSYACDDATLERGLAILVDLAQATA
ncbi:MAG: aminotransferase class I/II-fold pyridoxal phosphate-dependent enzyme [Planctomycetota bacterium]